MGVFECGTQLAIDDFKLDVSWFILEFENYDSS